MCWTCSDDTSHSYLFSVDYTSLIYVLPCNQRTINRIYVIYCLQYFSISQFWFAIEAVFMKLDMHLLKMLSCVLVIGLFFMTSVRAQQGDLKLKNSEKSRHLLDSYEKILDSWWNVHQLPPKLDSMEYTTKLVDFISDSTMRKSVLIVGGPKDSGKTTGIKFVSRAAENLGYHSIHLNLKGTVDSLGVKKVMNEFAQDFLEEILKVNDMYCAYSNVLLCPTIKESWNKFFDKLIATLTMGGLVAISINFIFTRCRWYFIVLLLLAITVIVYSLVEQNVVLRYMYRISFSALLIQQRISDGDWSTIFCCLNAIKGCDSMGPILFIRDVKNLQSGQLHELLEGLHKVKESENTKNNIILENSNEKVMTLTFPVIIETSDNLWMREAFCDTSNSAFLFYYLQPMQYDEGRQYMVKRYGLFDAKTYDKLYSLFGGHIRFYTVFWEKRNKSSALYDDIINIFETESKLTLNVCLMKMRKEDMQKETLSLFQQLINNNFTVQRLWLSPTVEKLIACNLLFFNAINGILSVQNPFLETEILHIMDSSA